MVYYEKRVPGERIAESYGILAFVEKSVHDIT